MSSSSVGCKHNLQLPIAIAKLAQTQQSERLTMHRPRLVGVGEILWDLFPDGPRFGGAPANFAVQAAAMGAQVDMVSGVGQDELGQEALSILEARGVGTRGVFRHSDRSTGTVSVTLDDNGNASYAFASDAAWDALEWIEAHETITSESDVICFGTLGQRSAPSRDLIRRCVAATPDTSWRLFDINLRAPFYDRMLVEQSLALSNALKLNDEELTYLAQFLELSGTAESVLRELAARFDLRAIILTLGSQGGAMLHGTTYVTCPGKSVKVVDTVGAGDAFTAACALGLACHDEPEMILRRANAVAAFVCSQAGATPELPQQL